VGRRSYEFLGRKNKVKMAPLPTKTFLRTETL